MKFLWPNQIYLNLFKTANFGKVYMISVIESKVRDSDALAGTVVCQLQTDGDNQYV